MGGTLIGLGISTAAMPGADPVADARKAEELGFDFVSASDHLHGGQPTYETWTVLSWIAAATSRIRVATRVLGVPYRQPAVLPPEQVPAMRERVLTAAHGAGRDPDEITCVYNVGIRVDEHADARPSVVAGSPDAVTARLLGFLELGFTALNLLPSGPGRAEQAERLAREVVPALRAAA
jgi:alkanesulfonate monooxygenase SsuD/methylene tetrahydromethanopterin reductase-like flavin-dependent oxidoreductase (luciferase family)